MDRKSMIHKAVKYFFLCLVFAALSLLPAVAQQGSEKSTSNPSASNPLVDVLKANGVLSAEDVAKIKQAKSALEAQKLLEDILLSKGAITKEQYDQVVSQEKQQQDQVSAQQKQLQDQVAAQQKQMQDQLAAQQKQVQDQLAAQQKQLQNQLALSPVQMDATEKRPSFMNASLSAQGPPNPTEPGAPSLVERIPSTVVNPALMPVRTLPVGGLTRGAMTPAFKAGGVGLTPYGFIKATMVEDSSSPQGDDAPLPYISANSGPNGDPEFHIKARSTRFGSNFEWYDKNPNWTITGKIEGDFEGNFSRADNRNLSTIRSSNPALRLAWGRLDYKFDANNTFSALFGQDWTLFASSTLPNMLETTNLGVGFGSLYERDPQMRVGYTHKFHGLSVEPEFSFNLPASGIPPNNATSTGLADQLGYGERQGPDSNRPEYQGRLVFQWQLDHAAGVPPAQIIFSCFDGRRESIVDSGSVPTAYQVYFPRGATVSSKQNGWDGEWQLPTRWFTLVGKFYSGADLRWFFAGQLYDFYTDTAGLTGLASGTANDLNTVEFGMRGTTAVVAPQRPIRSEGGFVQIGFPLSRIFHADPAGRNAGWSLYAMYGIDQAKQRDIDKADATRQKGTMAVGTLNYKLNRWVAFSYEQSLYTTHFNQELPTLPLFKGTPSRQWNDIREEGGPIFSW